MEGRTPTQRKRPIETYQHTRERRLNNPPAGLVTPATDRDAGIKTYAYDPHLDPKLVWAGKAEHTSFDVPTVSLHVHERIEPSTIIEAVRKRNGQPPVQLSLFEAPQENPPLRQAIEFYKHPHGWSNRLIAGDSLLVMNSLLEKEGLAGKVQMIYVDPPYGIKYGSNFQPFVNRRDVKDGRDEDLTAEPEMIKAFRDTWELGIHSYLTYLRDRLLLARELLHESGSVFVQISDENVHRVRLIMDEVFGTSGFRCLIGFRTTTGKASSFLDTTTDFIVWYSRSTEPKFRCPYIERTYQDDYNLRWVEWPCGKRQRLNRIKEVEEAVANGARVFRPNPLTSQTPSESTTFDFEFDGRTFVARKGGWKTNIQGMRKLEEAGRLMAVGNTLCFVRYLDDFPCRPVNNVWDDTRQSGFSDPKTYVVQTATSVIQRCLLMTTDPGDLVLDPTCGGGTTAYVAEQWGRRWITCDTSRVAITLAKQRLMTAVYDYYELAHLEEGVGSGFVYRTVPHVTLKSIANNPEIREGMTRAEIDAAIARHASQETLYDQPLVDRKKVRVTGPFTVEAVPAPAVRSPGEIIAGEQPAGDASVARSGETLRQAEWRDELLRTGIRGKNGQYLRFARLEPLPGCHHLHADGETRPSDEGADTVKEGAPAYSPLRVVVSFGPAHAPLEQRQVGLAIEEAQTLVPRPKLIVFAAFQFDPEAAKDIDETNWPGVTLLKAQMNADLLTEDLKKKRASNESYWLVGQPDVQVESEEQEAQIQALSADHLPLTTRHYYRVSVHGFDYYNTKTGNIESGSAQQVAVWLLDTDYDGRSLFPRQVFFPLADEDGGWARLARNLKAEIDPDLIEAYRGTVSLPFEAGQQRRIAVKIVDDRGIESLRVLEIE